MVPALRFLHLSTREQVIGESVKLKNTKIRILLSNSRIHDEPVGSGDGVNVNVVRKIKCE